MLAQLPRAAQACGKRLLIHDNLAKTLKNQKNCNIFAIRIGPAELRCFCIMMRT